jgi:N-acetylglucosaminyldiphosphoundecaprenol N-acetyl-beta-D-mannosaminyltransferase
LPCGCDGRHAILDVSVDAITKQAALRRIAAFIEQGTPHHVVTVNPEYVMRACREQAFRLVLNRADLATPDGAGLLLAARALGFRLPERVTGVDLIWAVAREGAKRGWRLYLLGAAPGVAERAAGALVAANQGLNICGTFAGTPLDEEAPAICRTIAAADPHVLLVAFGAPTQDYWIAAHQHDLRVPVAMGVGGALDFIAGEKRRAPVIMRRAGLEWLYRLIQEPWRWRRMLALPAFAAHVARAALLTARDHGS